MLAERRGTAMGTEVHLVVGADDGPLLHDAFREIVDLEHRWSRFLPDSELSAVNAHPGRPVIVSRLTLELIALAVEGWAATEGRFDPTVHDALVAAGYDRTFGDLSAIVTPLGPARPTPGASGVRLDRALSAVTVPHGVRLDLGGLAKGAAADRVSATLLARGAKGACVSIGGDVRVRGVSPFGPTWPLTLPLGPARQMVIDMADGAACTSTTARRRWMTTAGPSHHLIDPATGRPLASDLTSITVCAADAAPAEILTKSAFVLGLHRAADYLRALDLDAVLVGRSGEIVEVGRTRQFAA